MAKARKTLKFEARLVYAGRWTKAAGRMP